MKKSLFQDKKWAENQHNLDGLMMVEKLINASANGRNQRPKSVFVTA